MNWIANIGLVLSIIALLTVVFTNFTRPWQAIVVTVWLLIGVALIAWGKGVLSL